VYTKHEISCPRNIALFILILDAKWGWVDNADSRPFYYQGRDPVPILEEVDWTTGPVWKGRREENLFSQMSSNNGPSSP